MAAWELASAPVFFFFSPPPQVSTRSLTVPRGLHVPDCLPTLVGTVQKCCCCCCWVCGVCANECARVWGHVRGRRGCPGEVEGCRIGLVPLRLQVESEDLWLAVGLSPSPGGVFCFLSLPLTTLAQLRAKLPPPAPPLSYPLSRPCCLSRRGCKGLVPSSPRGWIWGREVPAVLVQAGLPWQPGGTASAPSPRWAQEPRG